MGGAEVGHFFFVLFPAKSTVRLMYSSKPLGFTIENDKLNVSPGGLEGNFKVLAHPAGQICRFFRRTRAALREPCQSLVIGVLIDTPYLNHSGGHLRKGFVAHAHIARPCLLLFKGMIRTSIGAQVGSRDPWVNHPGGQTRAAPKTCKNKATP